LGAGIPVGQGAEIHSGHGESPVVSLIFQLMDRITVENADVVRYIRVLESIASFERQ